MPFGFRGVLVEDERTGIVGVLVGKVRTKPDLTRTSMCRRLALELSICCEAVNRAAASGRCSEKAFATTRLVDLLIQSNVPSC